MWVFGDDRTNSHRVLKQHYFFINTICLTLHEIIMNITNFLNKQWNRLGVTIACSENAASLIHSNRHVHTHLNQTAKIFHPQYKFLSTFNLSTQPTLIAQFVFLFRFCDVYGDGNMSSLITYKLDLVLLMGRKP